MNVLSCHLIIAIQCIQIVFGCIIPDKTSQTAQQRILDAVRSLCHVLVEEVQNGSMVMDWFSNWLYSVSSLASWNASMLS